MMMHRRSPLGSLGWVLSAVTLLGCGTSVSDDDLDVSGSELRAAPSVVLTPFEDPNGIAAAGDGEQRRVIRSAEQYERVFGHALPEGVTLGRGEVVVFYSPGVQNTGGYEAEILSAAVRGRTLHIKTRLTSPGAGCIVTQALTHPYALAKLKRPRGVSRVRFTTDDVVRDCEAPPTCAATTCPEGQHCEITPVQCIKAPCPAVPECVPNEKIACGGFAGFPCPDGLVCVDDPSDDCDPNNGGADCGGLCRCLQTALCIRGTMFDSSPDVCACVPDPTMDPCAAVRCKAGTHCEANGDTAICEPDETFCGGIAGFPCPGAGQCEDDPDDDCDPNNGGADCGGRCVCNALGLCQAGSVWDDSPDVCGCVAETSPCAAVLCQAGTTCEVFDGAAVCVSDGTQECGPNTCGKGTSCCNSSCGICTQPGFFCIQLACLPTQ